MTTTLSLSRHYLRPHLSPTAVAYRATPQDTDRWIAQAALAHWERKAAYAEVADTWRHLFAQVLERTEAARVRPYRVVRFDHETPRRRHRYHWDLWASLTESREVVLPHCHLISGGCCVPGQAPDLRTRTGRAMQADLDTLAQVPAQTGDQLWDLPADGSTTGRDASGRVLGRSTLVSQAVAPGCRYLLFEAPPAQALDVAVWTPVPLEEYLAVKHEELT